MAKEMSLDDMANMMAAQQHPEDYSYADQNKKVGWKNGEFVEVSPQDDFREYGNFSNVAKKGFHA